MTLTELKYIVAVAREKHFGKAAEACFVSQPTLSVAVKKLEEELEVKLFERGSGEIAVTPLGAEIIRQAQSVLEQAAEIREIAKRGKDPLGGPLTLGVIYTIGDGAVSAVAGIYRPWRLVQHDSVHPSLGPERHALGPVGRDRKPCQ